MASRMARKLSRSSAAGFSINTCLPAFGRGNRVRGVQIVRRTDRQNVHVIAAQNGVQVRFDQCVRMTRLLGDTLPRTPPAGSRSQPPAPADPPQTPAHAQPPPTQPHAPPPHTSARSSLRRPVEDSTRHPRHPGVCGRDPAATTAPGAPSHPDLRATPALHSIPSSRRLRPGPSSSQHPKPTPHPDHPTIPSAQTNPDEPVESNNPPVAP